MNKIILIGNLTRDPELRTTSTGISVCSFSIAVNRRRGQNQDQPEADFFRITAWRQLGELCQRYLSKGRKVCVVGSVSVSTYEGRDGMTRASLEVTADEVEFLTPRSEGGEYTPSDPTAQMGSAPTGNDGFMEIDEDELPF
ncbi:MAG: single-stranded DNA-binding protein [Clostridiales bacterium]|nr:single-stranded DNA-binding protein [Clostridiales bacterium]